MKRGSGTTTRMRLAVKRVTDIVGGAVLLTLLSPLLALAALAIIIESPGSPIFTQVRAGLRGVPFRIYKFRSMVPGAELDGPVLSQRDVRITRVGRVLRRTSIDELPQLVNVLLGQMSLVGPRPQLLETTHPGEERRFDMRPGMTGLVQVNKTHLLSWDERMQLDISYVDRWTLRLDVWILLRTMLILFSRKDVHDKPRGAQVGDLADPASDQ